MKNQEKEITFNDLIATSYKYPLLTTSPNREIASVDVDVDQDLYKKDRMAILEALEDSTLVNQALLDEIESRIMDANPFYVTGLLRKALVADYVASGSTIDVARKLANETLTQHTKRGVAGFIKGAEFATETKKIAQQGIADRKAKYKIQLIADIKQFGSAADSGIYTDTAGDYFDKLNIAIKCKSDNPYSHDYTELSGKDVDTLEVINDYVQHFPMAEFVAEEVEETTVKTN